MSDLIIGAILLLVGSILLCLGDWTRRKEYSSFWYGLCITLGIVIAGMTLLKVFEELDINKNMRSLGMIISFMLYLVITFTIYTKIFKNVKPD